MRGAASNAVVKRALCCWRSNGVAGTVIDLSVAELGEGTTVDGVVLPVVEVGTCFERFGARKLRSSEEKDEERIHLVGLFELSEVMMS